MIDEEEHIVEHYEEGESQKRQSKSRGQIYFMILIYGAYAFVDLLLNLKMRQKSLVIMQQPVGIDITDIIISATTSFLVFIAVAFLGIVVWLPIRLVRGEGKSPLFGSFIIKWAAAIGSLLLLFWLYGWFIW